MPCSSSSSAGCRQCLVGRRQCLLGRVLLKSGRPQTATGSDHGHQGRRFKAGERGHIIVHKYNSTGGDTGTHSGAWTLWMQIAGLKVATHGGYQCAFTVAHQLIHGTGFLPRPDKIYSGPHSLGAPRLAAQSSPPKLASYLTEYLPPQRPCWPFYTVRSTSTSSVVARSVYFLRIDSHFGLCVI